MTEWWYLALVFPVRLIGATYFIDRSDLIEKERK